MTERRDEMRREEKSAEDPRQDKQTQAVSQSQRRHPYLSLGFTYIAMTMAFELSHTVSCVHVPHSKSLVL
jgi:hypothetical protein